MKIDEFIAKLSDIRYEQGSDLEVLMADYKEVVDPVWKDKVGIGDNAVVYITDKK